MKQFLKSVFCISLLLSSPGIISSTDCDSCYSSRSSCEDYSCDDNFGCNTGCNTYQPGCGYNQDCDNSCDNCSLSCDNSCSEDDCFSCDNAPVRTYLHIRSQGANTARELVGWQWDINLPFMCNNYGVAYLAYEYQRSFNSCRIANSLFGGRTLRFSGSLVPGRDSRNELLADNFGLSRTFQGSLTFSPRIQNHIIDLGYFMGLDCWLQGSYIRFHAPITYSHWSLQARECVTCPGSCTESACYYGSDDVASSTTPVYEPSVPVTTVATSLRQALGGNYLFGDMQTPWCAGRFDFCGRGKWGLADIDVILGYNFLNNDCYHFGAYLQMVLNTGPKPKDFYVFSPVVGNGGHFELGAGISAHWSFWSNETQNLALFLEGNITHMFQNEQCRLFDLCNGGAFSRYMLLKEYDTNGLTNTYNGNLVSATCFTNRRVDVKVDIKGDLAIKLAYRWCGWGIDVGYNIYGHSHETIRFKCDESNDCAPQRILSPKGTEGVCCFNYPVVCVPTTAGTYNSTIFPDNATLPAGTAVCDVTTGSCPTSSADATPFTGSYRVTAVTNNGSQPNATAYNGYPVTNPNPTTGTSTACAVALSANNTTVVPSTGALVSALVSDGYVLCNNFAPVAPLTRADLNRRSAESVSQLTNKIFGHINYTWYDKCGWNPQLGVGAEAEFSNRRNSEICRKADLEQWGVWFKGAITF